MTLGTSQENVHFFSFFAKTTHFFIKLSCFYPYITSHIHATKSVTF